MAVPVVWMKLLHRVIVGVLLCGCAFLLAGNSAYAFQGVADSLKQRLSGQLNDTTRVNALIALADELMFEAPNEALPYIEQAIAVAEKVDYYRGHANALLSQGLYFEVNNQPARALRSYMAAEQYFQNINDTPALASLFNRLGVIHKNTSRYDTAVVYFDKAFEMYRQIGDTVGIAYVYTNLGIIFTRKSDNAKATDYFLNSLKLSQVIGDSLNVARNYGNLGNVYKAESDYKKAAEYFEESLRVFRALNQVGAEAIVLNNLATVYRSDARPDKALVMYKDALSKFGALKNRLGQATCYSNIGQIYADQLNLDSSLVNNSKALDIFTELGDMARVAAQRRYIGSILTRLQRYGKAQDMLEQGLRLSLSINDLNARLDAYYALFEHFNARRNYDNALAYYRDYTALKDSVYNLEKSKQINDLTIRYEKDIKQKELEAQQMEQAQIIERKNFENMLLFGGFLAFLLLMFYFYWLNRQRFKANQQLSEQNDEINQKQEQIMSMNESLKQSQVKLNAANSQLKKLNEGLESTVKERTNKLQKTNEELDTFLYQSSHALRRPISQVKGLVHLARIEQDGQEVDSIYNKLDQTAESMDVMIHKLIKASEINFVKNHRQTIDFSQIVGTVWSKYTEQQNHNPICLELEVDPGITYNADPMLVSIILENLIENAIDYHMQTPQKQSLIEISVRKASGNIQIEVFDNGKGIPEETKNDIFNMFVVGHHSAKGFGLGLYLVKKAVDKLNGSISVESSKGHFTKFTIFLPTNYHYA